MQLLAQNETLFMFLKIQSIGNNPRRVHEI